MTQNVRLVDFIPFNEEYFIALMEKLKKVKLSVSYIKASKIEFPQPYQWRELPSAPYEKFEQGPIKRLEYTFEYNPEKTNVNFSFEEQMKRDIERGFNSVRIQTLELFFDLYPNKIPFYIEFQRKKITKDSKTQEAISNYLLNLATEYGLYKNMPSREFQRWRNNIYCLEATHVVQWMHNSPLKPIDVTSNRLVDEKFLDEIHKQSHGIIQKAAQVKHRKIGWVYDGLLTKLESPKEASR